MDIDQVIPQLCFFSKTFLFIIIIIIIIIIDIFIIDIMIYINSIGNFHKSRATDGHRFHKMAMYSEG